MDAAILSVGVFRYVVPIGDYTTRKRAAGGEELLVGRTSSDIFGAP